MSEIALVDMTVYGPLECKSSLGPLGTIAGIAVAIAVPFVAPAVAGAIFGGSVIAGSLGWLAVGATGAVLGGVGAAVTGNDWLTGALLGGVGGAAVQGLGGFGSVAANGTVNGLGFSVGQGALGGFGAAAPAASTVAPLTSWGGMTAATAPGAAGVGGILSGTAAPAATGLGATLGNILKVDPAKLAYPLVNAGVVGLTALGSELIPPSEGALAADAQWGKVAAGVDQQIQDARNVNPDYYAQEAANRERIRTAGALSEGTRGLDISGYNPQAVDSARRRAMIAGSETAGRAYYDAWLTADQLRNNRANAANAAYSALVNAGNPAGGSAEERKRRSEGIAEVLGPFAAAYAPATATEQVKTE
jgi:hypothetical protein